ncbi:MAG: ABC transporter permease subunit [Clostridia bacterium]|nr:ABC transporter permease subunit [Clostridia bacterium]
MKSERFEKRDSHGKIIFIYIMLTLAVLVCLYPLLDVVKISLRPGSALFSTDLSLIPENATIDNYYRALIDRPYTTWLKNSLFISLVASVVGVIFSISAAYGFSRFKFKGRSAGLVSMLLTQIFPAPMTLLPTYVLLKNFGLIDTYAGGIIPYIATSVPFSVWVLKGYFDTISKSIEESAYIDGANIVQILGRIMVPLALPAVGVVLLNSFMAAWNEFVVANIVFTNETMHTLPVGLFTMTGALSSDWGIFSAACVVTAIPVIIIFSAMSKVMINGLTLGGVKE